MARIVGASGTSAPFARPPRDAAAAGCDAYLSKPINRGELLRLVARHSPQTVNAGGHTY